MSLGIPEDAASVLEQFVHDVANTPAEITHLLEEIQAKDLQIWAFKDEIAKRDAQLQKWVRLNGGHVLNPKEEAFSRTISDCFDKCEILQAEKTGLAEKALIVLERQIKRFDLGLKGLATREEFPADWGGPTLLGSGSVTGVSTPVGTGGTTGGPLQVVSGNIGSVGGAANVANAAQMRLAQEARSGRSAVAGQHASPTANMPRSQRESSSEANKRRRLNASLGSLPAASSNLRQSSLGPGTPKAGTPVATGAATSRAGSAQPTRPSGAAGQKKGAPTAGPPTKKMAPHQVSAANKKRSRPSTTTGKKGDRRRQLARDRTTPSTNASASDDDEEEGSTSPSPSSLQRSQADGANDSSTPGHHAPTNSSTNGTHPVPKSRHRPTTDGSRPSPASSDADDGDNEDEEENDDQLYCYCQKVSFGDMVGCDNDNCHYQWFHWDCVGLKSEPEGEWLCPTCRKLPKGQVVVSKA